MGYCGNCGEKIEKGANFCGKCGAVVEKEQSEHVYDVIAPKNNSARVWKIIIPSLIVGVIVIWGFMQLMSVSDKPCDWCGHSPTVAYKKAMVLTLMFARNVEKNVHGVEKKLHDIMRI